MGATAQQFEKWRRHAKILSNESLQFVINDCLQAEQAMKGWNPEKENFYRDQYLTYCDEMNFRKKV